MKISIIIPTYNEEKVILNCLKSLEHQSTKNLEIIVVDDGSSDNTLDILKSFKTKNFSYKFLIQPHHGPALARNLGAKNAQGKILVFVDSDMTFDKNFVKNLTKPIIAGKSKGTFSKDEYVANWENVWARCWNFNENLPSKNRLQDNYPGKQKVFRAILKSEFDRAGGFAKGGYTDDYTLSTKLGYEADMAPNATVYHNNPQSPKEVFIQAKWASKRAYKLGLFGALGSSAFRLLLTPATAIYKALKYKCPEFVVFKIIYNLGLVMGVFEYNFLGKSSK
jgi:glycosyltransferase involved in cell wall biosynthesis